MAGLRAARAPICMTAAPQERERPHVAPLRLLVPPLPRLLPPARRLLAQALSHAQRAAPRLGPLRRALARLRSRWALRAANAARTAGGDVKRAQRVFRLNGLRWHHLAIARDLRRLGAHVDAFDCAASVADPATDRVAELHDIYAFFVDRIWHTYNTLERDVLFPWICEGGKHAPGHGHVVRALETFNNERDRIDEVAVSVRRKLEILARKSRSSRSFSRKAHICSIELRRVSTDIDTLLDSAQRLHETEQAILFPYIARQFTRDDQRSITNKIIFMMDPSLAKLNLVSFHEALKTTAATRADWRNYEREVPAPVRLYLWVWKGRLWDPSPLAKLDASVTNTPARRSELVQKRIGRARKQEPKAAAVPSSTDSP